MRIYIHIYTHIHTSHLIQNIDIVPLFISPVIITVISNNSSRWSRVLELNSCIGCRTRWLIHFPLGGAGPFEILPPRNLWFTCILCSGLGSLHTCCQHCCMLACTEIWLGTWCFCDHCFSVFQDWLCPGVVLFQILILSFTVLALTLWLSWAQRTEKLTELGFVFVCH